MNLIEVTKDDFAKNTPDATVIAKSMSDAGVLSEDPAEAKNQITSALNDAKNNLSGVSDSIPGADISANTSGSSPSGMTPGDVATDVGESGKGDGPLTQEKVNELPYNGYENLKIKIVDTETKKEIPIYSINDGVRLAKGGQAYKSVVGEQVIPKDLFADFMSDNDQLYPEDCVNNLGLFNTMYMRKRVQSFSSANTHMDDIEDDYVRHDLVFRNYLYGGASPYDDSTGQPKIITELKDDQGAMDEVLRISDRLGVGVGECTVLNPPFQFNKRDDPRTNPVYPKIGRVYSTQIMNNWPTVMFQPGTLKYNTGFFKLLGLGSGAGATESVIRTGGEGQNIFKKLVNVLTDSINVVLAAGSAIFGGGKIVEFKQSIILYREYLHNLLQIMAGNMNLTDISGRYFGSINMLLLEKILPISYLNGGASRFFNAQFIPFRCASNITASESFSNTMDSNPLMDKFNSIAEENDDAQGVDATGGIDGAIEKGKKFAKKAGMRLAGAFSEQALVLSGRGRITLPDVFSSSSFSRSISIELKFHSPYGDALSIFENEFMQLMFILAMGVPRQTGKMSYTSPFAVRVFVKNHIMINLGMIESISVTRGGDNNDWCPNGFPKTLTVSVQVKDCEPNISLPLASRGPLRMALEVMFPASGMSEYLGSIGGLPLDQMTHNWRKDHLKRAVSAFTAGWGRILDRDSIMTNVVNSRMGSALFGLINGTDADILNSMGDGNRMNMRANFENTIQQKFNKTGFYLNNTALNGDAGGFKVIRQGIKDTLTAIGDLAKNVFSGNSAYD